MTEPTKSGNFSDSFQGSWANNSGALSGKTDSFGSDPSKTSSDQCGFICKSFSNSFDSDKKVANPFSGVTDVASEWQQQISNTINEAISGSAIASGVVTKGGELLENVSNTVSREVDKAANVADELRLQTSEAASQSASAIGSKLNETAIKAVGASSQAVHDFVRHHPGLVGKASEIKAQAQETFMSGVKTSLGAAYRWGEQLGNAGAEMIQAVPNQVDKVANLTAEVVAQVKDKASEVIKGEPVAAQSLPQTLETSQPTTTAPSNPQPERQKYVIQSGDTLWAIAQEKLGDGNRWTEIRKADGKPFSVAETRRLYRGTTVYLPENSQVALPMPNTSEDKRTPEVDTRVQRPQPLSRELPEVKVNNLNAASLNNRDNLNQLHDDSQKTPKSNESNFSKKDLDPDFEEARKTLPDEGAGKHGPKKIKDSNILSKVMSSLSNEVSVGIELEKKKHFYKAADLAETAGLTDAARHMRHYLDNSGANLNVDVDSMLRDLPAFKKTFEEVVASAKESANQQIQKGDASKPMHFSVGSSWGHGEGHEFCAKESSNWFYAMGGFYYRYIAEVEAAPSSVPGGEVQVKMTTKLHVFDRYNWDAGKSTRVLEIIPTSDAFLAELHRAGVAEEYDITGSSNPVSTTWSYKNSSSAPTSLNTGTEDRDGKREDPKRERS